MKQLLLLSLIFVFGIVVKAQTPVYQSTFHIAGASDSTQLPAASASSMKGKEVKVNNGLDPGDCTKGGGSYVVKCTSDGTIWKPSPAAIAAVDVRAFGAKCDDSTDDAAAVQAAIDALGTTTATRNGSEIVIPGKCAIGSTILIDKKSVTFRGLGWGRNGNSGTQSYLRWIGASGSPMLQVQNVQGVVIKDVHFIGNATNKPSCAISSTNVSGFGINSNRLENIAIGDLNDGTQLGSQFTDGIRFEGSSGNNAEWHLDGIRVNNCARYGIKQSSVQQVNHHWSRIEVANSGTAGMYVVAQVDGSAWNLSSNAIDIITPLQDDFSQSTAPTITVTSYFSESGGRLIDMQGAASISITGGSNQTGSFTNSDGVIVKAVSANSNTIILRNFNLAFQVSSPTTAPYIDVTLATYANSIFKNLILENVGLPAGGPNSNGIKAISKGVLDWKHIKYTPFNQPTSATYIVPEATDTWIGGENATGSDFDTRTTSDVPSRFRYVPTYPQSITAASNTILLDVANRYLCNSTGGSITLTSAPTIPTGRNGEIINIVNVCAQAVVLQDAGTLSGSTLKLATSTVTLNTRDSIRLMFIGNDGAGGIGAAVLNRWIQLDSGSSPATLPANTVSTSHQFFTAYNSSTGAFTQAQPSCDDLSDCVTGTWTPVRNGFTEVLGGGSITNYGTYRKVGKLVTVNAYLVPAGGATIAGVASVGSYITGLPFAGPGGNIPYAAGNYVKDDFSAGGSCGFRDTGTPAIFVTTAFTATTAGIVFTVTYATAS